MHCEFEDCLKVMALSQRMGDEVFAGLAIKLGDRRASSRLDPLRNMLKLYGEHIGRQLTPSCYKDFVVNTLNA